MLFALLVAVVNWLTSIGRLCVSRMILPVIQEDIRGNRGILAFQTMLQTLIRLKRGPVDA